MSDFDLSIIITAIIAAIAVLTFLINFVLLPWYNKKVRLFIEAKPRFQIIQPVGVLSYSPFTGVLISVKVINDGKNPVYITEQAFKLSQQINGGYYAKKAYPTGMFPIKLEPGNPYRYEVALEDIYQGIIERLSDSDSIRIAIKDAKDKYHYSTKMKVAELKNMHKVALNNP